MRNFTVIVLAGAAAVASAQVRTVSADHGILPGLTYASLSRLPDWSGWWRAVDGPGGVLLYKNNKDQFLPEPSKALDVFFSGANTIVSHGEDCRPYAFVGDTGGYLEDVEFIFSPGRLTITNESGLVRRIYFDGRSLPRKAEESNNGTSVARWVGKTLLIQTTGLKSTALFPENSPGFPVLGSNASLVEKLGLNDRKQLVNEVELTAPGLLKAPLRFTVRYERDPGHVERDHDTCIQNDRQIDPKTGLQRFDMTPPADLPPPPPVTSSR